jgi:hypothetical protein
MRASIFIAALALVGCKWTDFDDLADTTWVRSTNEPSIGSRNYAIAITGVTTSTSGGQLAVISDDVPDFSTIDYAADGTDKIGTLDVKLGQHRIAALTDPPLLTTDGMGKIALAERSTTPGNIAVVFGPASGPVGLEFAAQASPDAVAFVGADVVVAAGNTLYTLQMAGQIACASTDTTFGAAALAADATNLWVWAKSGAFFSIPLTALVPCTGGMLPAPSNTFSTTGLMPAPGAQVHVVGNLAILTAHPPTSRMGQVVVVDLTTMTQTDMMNVEGLRSSAVATFGTQTYLVVGVPDSTIDGVVSGQVDLYALDTTMGKLTTMPALQLNDSQPESGELFGRSVTTMKFNEKTILVVAANSEVFAYYKTALYDAMP